MSHNITSRSRENGQGLVEFAMVLVIMMILLAGVVDLGRAFFTFLSLRDAAQEGAAYASINPGDSVNIINRVRNSSARPVNLNDTANIGVQINLTGAACAGNGVEVLVTYDQFPLTMPFLGSILGAQTIPIRARITDTILTPPCK